MSHVIAFVIDWQDSFLCVDSKHKSALSKYKTGVTERDTKITELETKLASKEAESQTQLNLIEEEVCTTGALWQQSIITRNWFTLGVVLILVICRK